MEIICHRGFWLKPKEKNSKVAFTRSFSAGFGLETDLRDHNGELVIAHDIPKETCLSFDDFAEIYKKYVLKNYPLALNIKADGLHELVISALKHHGINNYFVFDMSIPDTLNYINTEINFFTRQSEIEPQPAYYTQACGVWADCFHRKWMNVDDISGHLDAGKQVCLVSPELHRRPHENFWLFIKKNNLHKMDQMMLCTDFPQKAKDFFND